MGFSIRMGLPEMFALWQKLSAGYVDGTISRSDAKLYKKWGKSMKLLADNPFYPGLNTHEIAELSKRYGMKVWQSYLENNTSRAMRRYWVYGPEQKEITIIGLEPHPEDKKNGAYDKVLLSHLPEKES